MTVKNMVYAGLGLGTMVTEKSMEAYKSFVESGKKADPGVNSAIESFFDNLDLQHANAKERIEDLFEGLADKLGYIKIEDYEHLQKRIKNLEADLAKAEK